MRLQPQSSDSSSSPHIKRVSKWSVGPWPASGNTRYASKMPVQRGHPRKPISFISPFLLRQRALSSSAGAAPFRRQPGPEAQRLSHAAEVFQTTLQVLKDKVRQRQKRDVKTARKNLSNPLTSFP